jgi:cardiolipin synthase (CMP-forming)
MGLARELKSVPNLLSLLRLALVPIFLVLIIQDYLVWALAVLAIAGISDWLDGYIARKFNQITELGKMLDPAADRLYIFASLIGLTLNGTVPAWLAILVIARDVMLLMVYPVLASRGYGPLPVHFLGKAGTFALLYALPLLLLADIWPQAQFAVLPLAWAFSYWGVALYWLAGFIYLAQVKKLVSKAR